MNRNKIALAERFASEFAPKGQTAAGGDGAGDAAQPRASGSGFFISKDGSLVSNFHVVEGASRVVVKTGAGVFPATVVKFDMANDIALLKVSGLDFHALPIATSGAVKLGESVFTIGFPNPELQGVEPKMTDGKVSSLTGARDDPRYFQISLAVQPGNSGGALVNLAGEVVGIVSAKLSAKAALVTSGELPENVNYAVKSSFLLGFLESVPDVSAKLKDPNSKEQKFEDVVKSAEKAAALVLVY